MIDVIILNRNLGEVCDNLVERLNSFLIEGKDQVIVVDSGSEPQLRSRFTSIGLSDELTHQQGLRFGRGMNLGLQHRESLENKILGFYYFRLIQKLLNGICIGSCKT